MRSFDEILLEAQQMAVAGNHAEAFERYNFLLSLNPDDWRVLYMAGAGHMDRKENGLAIPFFLRALQLNPKDAETWNSLGVCYRKEQREERAQLAYQMATELNPGNPNYWSNFSGAFINQGDPEKILEYARKGLELDPNHVDCNYHMAFGLLEQGQYEKAWDYYAWRKQLKTFTPRPYKCQPWDGKSKVDVLAISGEQGIGDEILFMSCLDDVRPFAKHIVVECTPRLKRIFERSFGVPCYGNYDEMIQFEAPDAHVQMGDLPGFFRRSESDFPKGQYLRPDPGLVATYHRLLTSEGDIRPIIGLAWNGGTRGTHSESRTINLKMMEPILKFPARFLSLQYNDHPQIDERIKVLPHHNEIDELSAMAGACDLVISVDQTIVHQAGAMGKETWVLVSNRPSFRYKMSGEIDWYGSVRLFRQARGAKDWTEVIQEISNQLEVRFANQREIQGIEQRIARA